MATLKNKYYVGKNQQYKTVSQVLNTLKEIIDSGDVTLPNDSLSDGGNVNIIMVGGGAYQPFVIPDNLTPILNENGRRLVITRQEYTDENQVVTIDMPKFTSAAPGASEVPAANKAIGIDIGNNNPAVTLRGLRVENCVMGIRAGFNSNDLHLERNFVVNCLNTQVYIHDLDGLYAYNNVIVGGEFGFVAKYVKKIRFYHNTVFVDGSTALDNAAKAGVVLQGERLFGNTAPSTIYSLGNLVYTAGAPCFIYYSTDLDAGRIVSDYNDLYNPEGQLGQIRQDNVQEDNEEVIKKTYTSLQEWRAAGPMGSSSVYSIDAHSVSVHPLFIQNLSKLGSQGTSILDLSVIGNSPILEKVPSWYFTTDPFYIPSDVDETDLSLDSLLVTREKPLTAIGANDAPSTNGYFGEDIFTSPLLLDPEKSCDLDPFKILSVQNIDMQYPAILAGYFWSHERPYYLYGKKGAAQLGYFAQTTFTMPGFMTKASNVEVTSQGKVVPEEDWDIVGQKLVINHKSHGIESMESEIQIKGKIQTWYQYGFSLQNAYYVFKVKDGKTVFIMPDDYQSQAPVVITDDRTSTKDPVELVRKEFTISWDENAQKNILEFSHTDNLIENSSFIETYTNEAPAKWLLTGNNFPTGNAAKDVPLTTASKGEAVLGNSFMLGSNYSYYGDYCAGLRFGDQQGWLGSNLVNIEEGEPITFSWHCRIPTGMGMTGATGHYSIHWFDKDSNLTQDDPLVGTFHIPQTGYNRYYLTAGNVDTVIPDTIKNVKNIPMVQVTGLSYIPSGTVKAQIAFSGQTDLAITGGEYYMLDAVQAEYSNCPTYYHPNLSFQYMTVEYETDPTGVFIDKRMNLTPIFNENPNGFLHIQEMPAKIWDGPSDVNVTTLHEFRWPEGRIFQLPWARLHGKDKLAQKVFTGEMPYEPLNVIHPLGDLAVPAEADMFPDTVLATQYTGERAGFNIRVIDKIGNPYSLRKYTAHVYDPNDHFPGWLAKKHLGAKEQLGTTIYGELNNNGSFSATYIPPGNEFVKYAGKIPQPDQTISVVSGALDTIATLEVPYNCNLDNNGNITVVGENGYNLPVNGTEPIKNIYYAQGFGNQSFVSLEYPPVFGSTKVSKNGQIYFETEVEPQQNEFFVNYAVGQITLGLETDTSSPFEIEYLPKYAYPDPNAPNVIIMHHNKIFGNYNGPIQVDYDAELFIEVRVEKPYTGQFVSNFPVIIQNPILGLSSPSSLALEF